MVLTQTVHYPGRKSTFYLLQSGCKKRNPQCGRWSEVELELHIHAETVLDYQGKVVNKMLLL